MRVKTFGRGSQRSLAHEELRAQGGAVSRPEPRKVGDAWERLLLSAVSRDLLVPPPLQLSSGST